MRSMLADALQIARPRKDRADQNLLLRLLAFVHPIVISMCAQYCVD